MDWVKPKEVALVQQLLNLNKPYLSPADLEKILGQARPALYVTLNRLVDYGVLVRLRRGVYQVALRSPDLARIANQLVFPSYLSFESALSRYGIMSQVPYTLSFATDQRSQRTMLGETEVVFRQLKEQLFFAYSLTQGLYLAEPEKALLDTLYMASRGLGIVTMEELDLSRIDLGRLKAYAARFPRSVQTAVQRCC